MSQETCRECQEARAELIRTIKRYRPNAAVTPGDMPLGNVAALLGLYCWEDRERAVKAELKIAQLEKKLQSATIQDTLVDSFP